MARPGPSGKPAKGLIELWSDGSFQSGQAGGAAVKVNAANDGLISVHAWQYKSVPFDFQITESNQAEIVTALFALESAAPDTVRTIHTDCPFVASRLEEIRYNKLNTGKYNGLLFDRLTAAIRAQDGIKIQSHTRGEGRMPVANAFAQAAARGDTKKLEAESRRFRTPFTFSIMTNNGPA